MGIYVVRLIIVTAANLVC